MQADDREANNNRKKKEKQKCAMLESHGFHREMLEKRADNTMKKKKRRKGETTGNVNQVCPPECISQEDCSFAAKNEFCLEEKRRHKKKGIGDDHEQEAQNSKHHRNNKKQKFLSDDKKEICHEGRRRKQKGKGVQNVDAQEEEVAQNERKHNGKSDKQMSERDLLEGSKAQSSTSPSRYTISMAVAASIVNNAQSLLLATMLVGQIARAAVIFRVDEIIVFDDDNGTKTVALDSKICQDADAQEKCGSFMVRILQYLEVPQYLRRALVPLHNNLKLVGMLPPLDAPHHLRKHEWLPFREGVVGKRSPTLLGSYVDVGLDKEVFVDQSLQPGTRVTVNMGSMKSETVLTLVGREAVQEAGIYWGYKVRYASCLSAVFEECPFEGKYDYCIGTSEHGEKIGACEFLIPKFRHLLIAFGGLGGLEESMQLDQTLRAQNMRSLFHRYVNTCPNQGSRTIRTEEAILISLQCLQMAIQRSCS